MAKNQLVFAGRTRATMILHAKHKKDGSVILSVYPAKTMLRSRQLASIADYDKSERIGRIKFLNISGLDTFMIYLKNIRDNMIFRSGYKEGYVESEKENEGLYKAAVKETLKAEALYEFMSDTIDDDSNKLDEEIEEFLSDSEEKKETPVSVQEPK